MRLLLIVCAAVGVSTATGIVQPESLWQTYRQLYPADPGQRRALNECFTQDPNFNRLDAAAREACFRHNAPALGSVATAPVPQQNFVDLWQAAGQGRMPQNDIRAEQRNDRFFHPPANDH
jgi:hypothetical protein